MTNGSIINTNGKKILLYRGNTENGSLSSTEYLPLSQFKVGVDNSTPNIANNDLDNPIPISNGTVCDDGSNNLTGSDGGDNTTDNILTYKEGAGVVDATAQNLIANDTNATKKWEIADLTTNGANAVSTKYISQWLYIRTDDLGVTLAKFKSSGTCLEIRLGADTTANYYSQTLEASDLAVGWNLLCDNALLSTWTTVGTPGTLNNFAIIITTNNATDEFIEGDVIYDLLRQWEASDLTKDFTTSYPTIDLTNLEVTTRAYLTSLEANGFLIDGLGFFNEDTSPLMGSEDTMDGASKSDTDEFAFVVVDRLL